MEVPEAREYCVYQAAEIDARYESLVEERALVAAATQVAKKPLPQTPAESLTDGTTLDNSSGISTPRFGDFAKTTSSRKRKAAPQSFEQTPTPSKHSKRISA